MTGQPGDPPPLIAEEVFSGRVLKVVSGDTLVVERFESQVRVHLLCLQAADLDEPWGAEARELLEELVLDRLVSVRLWSWEATTESGKGRIVLGERDVRVPLLESGLARYVQRHGREPEMLAAQEAARGARRGLWESGGEGSPPG